MVRAAAVPALEAAAANSALLKRQYYCRFLLRGAAASSLILGLTIGIMYTNLMRHK
jgi:hypothetical protein